MFQLFLQIINIIKIGNIRTDWYRKLYMKTSNSPKFSLILTIFLVIFFFLNVLIPQRAKISQVAKCANTLMLITDNSIQKYIQLISMFSESLWSCSNMKIRLIYQIPLEIQTLKHQESGSGIYLVRFNQSTPQSTGHINF